MKLEFKPDWDETKERFKKWWAHEHFGRCALAVTAPRDGLAPADPPPRPATPHERWTVGYPSHMSIPTLLDCPHDLDFNTGSGKPSPLHYLATLKAVQRAGKNLHITISCDEVETALKELSARGLMIMTSCQTEAEAKALLANAKKWSKDRRV